MINNYVKMICGMLELPMPQVFYNDSALEPGQHARLTPDGKQLYPGVTRSRIESRIAEIRRDEFPQLAGMKLPH